LLLQFKIRREAILGLGSIYKSVTSRDPVDPQQASRVDWIRNKVFHHYYQNSNDDRYLLLCMFVEIERQNKIYGIILLCASVCVCV
jgi:hypothetical protein